MGTCVICGTEVDGHICASHEEDVYFEFTGTRPDQLQANRFYQGSVDGYADFGVFVDVGDHVTGLLHRSELPQRLESLDWEPGDEVFVKVTNVRDNGNVDLSWSIRQAPEEFRGHLVHTPQGDELPEEASYESAAPSSAAEAQEAGNEEPAGEEAPADSADEAASAPAAEESAAVEPAGTAGGTPDAELSAADAGGKTEPEPSAADASGKTEPEPSAADASGQADAEPAAGAGSGEPDAEPSVEVTSGEAEPEPSSGGGIPEPSGGAMMEAQLTRSEVAGLADEVGSPVRLEGEVVDVRQTSGPTIFEVSDETGTVDCAAFESAGVRAYPDVEVGDVVRVDGLVEDHRGEVQVETESLVALEAEEAEAVAERLEAAIEERARPGDLELLADHPAVESVREDLRDAATAVRRAVFEARPVVVRHRNTADGYVAAAAIERAALPLVREQHEGGDAEYHYVDRRPLESRVYGLGDAMRDVTRLVDAGERHGEKVPLFVFVGAGSTAESLDALDLLGVYGAGRVVVDGGAPDTEATGGADTFVSPHLAGAEDADTATSAALGANLAAAVNPEVRDELRHLPAVSYWRDPPAAYVELAADAGYGETATARLREAVTLEAFYQVYEDKRELVADLLFGDAELAEPASEQFRTRLDEAVRTAEPHLETWSLDGASLGVLDVEAYTHQYDFPPTEVLLRALADRADDFDVVLGVDTDELTVWSAGPVDLRAVAEAVDEAAPEAGAEVRGGRDGSVVFLAGERDAVLEAAIAAVAEQV